MERKNTAPSPENPEAVKHQLKKWLAAGRTPSTAFLFGTSVELIVQAARTHTISPYPIDTASLDYQRQFASKKRHVYYTYPDLTNFNYHFPDLAKNYVQRVKADDPSSTDIAHHNWVDLKGYALWNALVLPFSRRTGLELDSSDIIKMAQQEIPTYLAANFKHDAIELGSLTMAEVLETANDQRIDQIRRKINPTERKRLLERVLLQNGCVVAISKDVSRLAQFQPGIESDNEMLLTCTQPLPSSVIEGVIPLSANDRNFLLNEFHL